MDLNFGCTRCGKCCHDLKIPLTVTEALDWLRDGRKVQILCEAIPWPREPSPDDGRAAHRRRRSFAAVSGTLPIRVIGILAANFAGACPNLRADLTCGIYERRPLVCRIYPAEINPFIRLEVRNKVCPPEAWAAHQPLLQSDGVVMDPVIRNDIQASRDADAGDTQVKMRLCAALGVRDAAMTDDGFVVHSPPVEVLFPVLCAAASADAVAGPPGQWRFVSNQTASIDALRRDGAIAVPARAAGQGTYDFLGLKPEFPLTGS